MAKYETHIQNVKNHLNNGLSITSWEAIQLYHCTRLSAVIYSLKDRHDMIIVSEMVSGEDGVRFAKYHQVASSKTKQDIKQFLLDGCAIDSSIALVKFNCDHLQVVIRDLRKEGLPISYFMTEGIDGHKTKFYSLSC